MNKYKVEFKVTRTYILDVLADSEKEAEEKADSFLNEAVEAGKEHLFETEMSSESVIYNVNNTDDPFSPNN